MSGDEMDAGREMDERIAVEVMGWLVNHADGRHWHTIGAPGKHNPHRQIGADCCADKYAGSFMPSRDISAAFEVVERLTKAGLDVVLSVGADETLVEVQYEVDQHHWAQVAREVTGLPPLTALPLAIARASLDPAVLEAIRNQKEGERV